MISPDGVSFTKKAKQEAMASYLKAQGMPKRAERHAVCGRRWITFGCEGCGTESHRSIERCDLRTCADCARKHAAEVARSMVEKMNATPRVRGFRVRLITVTVRTEDGQQGMIDAARTCMDATPKLWKELLKVKGGGALVSLEAGGKRGNIHSHWLYYGPYVNKQELSDTWSELSGGSYIVDVRLARSDTDAIREVAKYLVKADIGPDIAAQLEVAVFRRRRLRTYGIFFGVKIERPPKLEKYASLECPHCGICGGLSAIRHVLARPWATGPPH